MQLGMELRVMLTYFPRRLQILKGATSATAEVLVGEATDLVLDM